jgi:N-dimethylarginine dimethylaminohydrolase
MSSRDAVIRMTYAARQVEPSLVEKAMERLGVPVAQRITPPALVEGGDFVWLNEETAAPTA